MIKKRIFYEKNAPQANFFMKFYFIKKLAVAACYVAGKIYQTKCAAGWDF